MATMDNINELIENIEKDNFNYVIGIIKKGSNQNEEKIDIYTNLNDNPIDKLLKILQEYKNKKSVPSKLKNKNIIKND